MTSTKEDSNTLRVENNSKKRGKLPLKLKSSKEAPVSWKAARKV
jgi:hypothetical protein